MRIFVTAVIFLAMITHGSANNNILNEEIAKGDNEIKLNHTRIKLLTFLAYASSKYIVTNDKCSREENFSLLSWNTLAPMWVNETALLAGSWDINLLNRQLRFELLIDHILKTNADIVTLQEVQEDVFYQLQERLSDVYTTAGLASNINNYWISYLPEGKEYVANGVATFYKTKKFHLKLHRTFMTNSEGSRASATVLKSKCNKSLPNLIVMNSHFDSELNEVGIRMRITQASETQSDALLSCINTTSKPIEHLNYITSELMGSKVMNEAKKIEDEFAEKGKKSVVIISLDANSFSPFPGYNNFLSNGYSSAMEVTNSTMPTYYYSEDLILPPIGETPFTNLVIDYVFIRNADLGEGKMQLMYGEVPNGASDELNEKNYIERVSRILESDLRRKGLRNGEKIIRYLMESEVFETLQNMMNDQNDYKQNINKVLRLGSDHLPLLLNFKLLNA